MKYGETSKLLQCLSQYNCLLEVLDIYSGPLILNNGGTIIKESLTSQPFEDLSRCCPLLKDISFLFYKIPSQVLSTLVHIEKITLTD